jgi:pyrroline-5-carboxylate reductase
MFSCFPQYKLVIMQTKTMGFIGGGRITRILLNAFFNKKLDLSSVLVYDTNREVTGKLRSRFPDIRIADSLKQAAGQEMVFIALHPPAIMETLEHIKEWITEEILVLSLAPKISIEKIAAVLPTNKIVRLIPNATSYVNKGYNPVSFAGTFSDAEKKPVLELLSLCGDTFEVEENKLEAYALVSAMLPTYFWFQWDTMEALGKQMGLEESESKDAVEKTLKAAIDLFYNPELTSEEVIDLIPVKPIGDFESQIMEIYNSKLMGLYEKIKP